MSNEFASEAWMQQLENACAASDAFTKATAFADTKLVFQFGDRLHFWKIYRGRIIDSHPFVRNFDPLGYDVCIRATRDVWLSIAERRSKVWDHLNGFAVEIGGNHMDAHRLHEALLIICQDIIPTLTSPTNEKDNP